MTAKEYLEQVEIIDKQIEILTEQAKSVQRLTEKCAMSVTARITGMPKAKDKTTSPMADAVCEMLSQEQEIADEIKALSIKREGIRKTVNALVNPDYRNILSKRYLAHKPLTQIISETGYSKSWVQKTLARAIDELETMI